MKRPEIDFTRFYHHKDLCACMRAMAAWKPETAAVRTMGESPLGREILLLEITNPETGPASEKPTFLVHGNIHAGELSGSACALYMADYLLANADENPSVKELLDTVAFHIIPRVSPDGAEEVLTLQRPVRSREIREKRKNCIWPKDLNRDGRILQMRVPDPNGPWFAPYDEPRLMSPRLPGDGEGTRYRLTAEGLIHDWDGGPWEDPVITRFDFNRNWPHEWRPGHQQSGAGPYPFSEPEVRALADHVLAHPYIFGMFGLHNGTNAILRPPTSTGDSEIGAEDILTLRRLAALGSEITGFPPKAIHEYRNALAHPIRLHGTFTEWGYRHCGLFAMEIELGNLYNGAGYDTEAIFSMTPEGERQRDRDALAWHDAHPEAGIFVDWQPFDHPQLGPVEIGGITPEGLYNVVPAQRLDIWEKTRQFVVELARRGPRLVMTEAKAEPLGEHLFRVTCEVANEGHWPTHVTALGAGLTQNEGVCVEIERRGRVEFVAGRNRTPLGHLQPAQRRTLTWVVRSSKRSTITLVANAPHAGRCERKLTLRAGQKDQV